MYFEICWYRDILDIGNRGFSGMWGSRFSWYIGIPKNRVEESRWGKNTKFPGTNVKSTFVKTKEILYAQPASSFAGHLKIVISKIIIAILDENKRNYRHPRYWKSRVFGDVGIQVFMIMETKIRLSKIRSDFSKNHNKLFRKRYKGPHSLAW